MFTSITIRYLLSHLLAIVVVLGVVTPQASGEGKCGACCAAVELSGSCCDKLLTVDCGMACCQQLPIEPMPAPVDHSAQLQNCTGGAGVSQIAPTAATNPLQLVRHIRSLAVPASGSPSLVTQHICLQV